jgi:hypothetical protein
MVKRQTMQPLKLGTGWIRVTVTSEVEVVLTFRGYAPVLHVRQAQNNLEYILYVSAKSLAEPLERLRQENGGKFTGLDLELRKASSERFAPYEVRNATDTSQNT